MKKWYQAMCVVRLGTPVRRRDDLGESVNVRGYVVNVGLCGSSLMQAMIEVERIALLKFDGARDGNYLEEANIKTTDLESLRGHFQLEEKGADGEPVFRSGLIFFDE
jgi:hypothetical protein